MCKCINTAPFPSRCCSATRSWSSSAPSSSQSAASSIVIPVEITDHEVDGRVSALLRAFIIGLDARTKPYDLQLAIFGYEGWADYRTIETPTMLLCGDGDFFVNQERIDYTCTLFPNCEVHPLIENAGAFIGLEQPEAFAEAIIEFLIRPQPGSGGLEVVAGAFDSWS